MALYQDGRQYVPQPYSAFLQFKVDGVEYPMIRPENFLSAKIEMASRGLGCKLTAQFFDRKYFPIHQLFLSKEVNKWQWRWGYVDGIKSEWYKGTVYSVTPTYQDGGVMLDIEMQSSALVGGHDQPKRHDYGDKTIAEIVREICKRNNWKLEMKEEEEPVPVKSNDSMDRTEETNIRMPQTDNMTDMQYLKLLLPYCKTKDGKGGYECWYDAVQNKLHFHPPRANQEPVRIFYINYGEGVRNTEVRSYTPNILTKWIEKLGGDKLNTVTMDVLTKRITKTMIDYWNTPEKENYGAVSPALDKQEKDRRRILSVFHDPLVVETHLRHDFYTWQRQVVGGSLNVQGDHRLVPGEVVEIYFFTDAIRDEADHEGKEFSNRLLYISGRFLIKSASHDIEGGDYSTTLELMSNSLFVAPEGSKQFKEVPGEKIASKGKM